MAFLFCIAGRSGTKQKVFLHFCRHFRPEELPVFTIFDWYKRESNFHFRHYFCTTSGIRKESICPAFAVASAWYKKEKLFAFCTTHALPNPHAESLLIPLLLRFCTRKRSGTKEKTIFHFRHRFRPAFSES